MSLLPKDDISRRYMLLGFKIVGDFGATIAVPVVLFVWIAQRLEGKYGGEPWLTLIAFILSAGITIKLIVKKAKEYDREYKKLNELKKNSPKD